MISVSHTEGPRFDPGPNQLFESVSYDVELVGGELVILLLILTRATC